MSIKNKAFRLGATEFGRSKTKDKKYYVVYRGKVINFGQKGYEDFTIHKDEKRRQAYRKRHMAIKTKSGKLAYKDKMRSAYWALNLLWD